MADTWITTQWPSLEPENSPARHLFFKTGTRRQIPHPGDVVLIYESAHAVVAGKAVLQTYWCHQGQRKLERVPLGRSAIISKVIVAGWPRPIASDDIVRDYGDLHEWSVIPCRNQVKVCELPKADLMELLGHVRSTPARFLSLYRIADPIIAQRLLERIEAAPDSL